MTTTKGSRTVAPTPTPDQQGSVASGVGWAGCCGAALAARADDHARQDRRYSGRSVCLARRSDRRCRVPYGYHCELAKAVISIDDQAAVRRIVARRAEGVILRDLRRR